MHYWNQDTGKKIGSMKICDVSRSHTTISTIAFSHKFRLYVVVTADFRMFFLNECLNIVQTIDMNPIRLVNFVAFNDKDDKIVVAGIKGVFMYDMNYKSKYSPKLAASIDQEGKHISLKLENQKPLDKIE